MPVPLWTASSKAEAKYNVVTEFPKLGLHAAAASGNVGLVEYALEHGQPINSVLDGVLPIHAASAGGHPQVVKKLIEHGADVNAPRLPRRYFNDRNRDASAPIVGTSGSTPLHFAAANGNTNVVTLLLLHGAHPDRADKYGVTPEALARENNWLECAQLLHDWILNKDRDLREREVLSPGNDGNGAASSSGQAPGIALPPEPESPSFRRRLHVKHSIDTALNILKTSSHSDISLKPVSMGSPPPSPMKGDHSFDTHGSNGAIHTGSRRPSLPQSLQSPPSVEETNRSKPAPSTKIRRPRSAGTGADRSGEHEIMYLPHGRGGAGRKLGGKVSLLGLFKKAQHSDGSELPTPSSSNVSTPPKPPATPLNSTSSGPLRTSSVSTTEFPDVIPHVRPRNNTSSDTSSKGVKITPQSHPQPSSSFLELDSPVPPSPRESQPPLPSAVDLHRALAQRQQGRDRSRSNATTVSSFSEFDSDDDEERVVPITKVFKIDDTFRQRSGPSSKLPSPFMNSKSSLPPTTEEEQETHPTGILVGHRRTASSSQASPSPARALRFDAFSTPDRIRKEGSLTGAASSYSPLLRPTASSHSLGRPIQQSPLNSSSSDAGVGTPFEDGTATNGAPEPSGISGITDDKEEPGETVELPSPSGLKSFGTASQPSLPPIFADDNTTVHTLSVNRNDFPFSIHRPPPEESDKSPSAADHQLQIPDIDRRGRGDSVSSTCTADSSNMPPYSTSGSTIDSAASATISTPSVNNSLSLPDPKKPVTEEDKYPHIMQSDQGSKGFGTAVSCAEVPSSNSSTWNARRAQSPLDIDIGAISSHAQAQALVEKTRQDILDLASGQDVSSRSPNSGPTPLSAKLAAYGESLALQRKLQEQEDAEKMRLAQSSANMDRLDSAPVERNRSGVGRQLSLDKSKSTRARAKKDPRRPSTADGLSTRPAPNSFFPGESVRTHQVSLSVSPPALPQTSTSFDGRDSLSAHQRFPTSVTPSKSLLTVPEPFQISPPIVREPPVDIEDEDQTITRMSSTDSLDTDMDLAPVPARHAPSTSAVGHLRNKQALTASSAKKLNRMGFTVVDQVARPSQPSSGKVRGFKSIMQTLIGKS